MEIFDLDQPLIELTSSSGTDYWTIRNAVEGVQIFGGIGSGKTSGSGKTLAIKYLQAGFGGLVLTVKNDEKKMWKNYCRQTGREDDLVVLEPQGVHSFNFLDYESKNGSDELAATDNIVDVLHTVIEAGQVQGTGKDSDPFWANTLDLLVTNTIDLSKLAYGRISLQTIYDIVQTIPKADDAQPLPNEGAKAFHKAFETARTNVTKQIDEWIATLSPQDQSRFEDDAAFESELLDAVPDARLLKFIDQFFVDNFINLSEKTRSIIDISFASFLFRLLREPFYSLFSKYSSTVTPESCFDGKIVLVNLPVKEYYKAGREAQLLVKYVFQRAFESRDVMQNGRPVFLWADEAQTFLHEKDAEFQATARSSRVATVYLSQNLPNYMASMGGHKAEYRVKSFLGTLATKIFHANADTETNEYSSKLVGEAYFEDKSESVTVSEHFSQTQGKSLKLERLVRAEKFASLRTGGPKNQFYVEGYMHVQGHSFSSGFNHQKMLFKQSN